MSPFLIAAMAVTFCHVDESLGGILHVRTCLLPAQLATFAEGKELRRRRAVLTAIQAQADLLLLVTLESVETKFRLSFSGPEHPVAEHIFIWNEFVWSDVVQKPENKKV